MKHFFKKRKFLLYFIFLSLQLNGQVTGFDKVGTTSFQFLTVIPNAHFAGMGGAFSAVNIGSDAVFFNPAALKIANKFEFSVAQMDWFQDSEISSFSFGWKPKSSGTITLQLLSVNIGKIQETRADHLLRDESGQYNPGLTGNTFSPSSLAYGIGYSNPLTDKFTFGIAMNNATEDLVYKKSSTIVYDIGLLYETGYKTIKIGSVLRNFGNEVTFFDEPYPLPQSFIIGISSMLFGPSDALIGSSSNNNLLLAYDLSQTRDHSQQQHLGIEYNFNKMFYLRFGNKSNFDAESYTFGIGIKINGIDVDYAYNSFGSDIGGVSRLGMRIWR